MTPAPALIAPRRTQTAAGQRLLRILAGFNLLVLAGVLALGVGQIVAAFQPAWWAVVPAGVIAFLAVHWTLTTLGPLDAHPGAHVVSWVLVAALALLSSPPVGLLVITGAIVSTVGPNLRPHQGRATEGVTPSISATVGDGRPVHGRRRRLPGNATGVV